MNKKNKIPLSFLTWNIYVGADLSPLIQNQTPQVVTEVFRQFLATDFRARAKAIANEMLVKQPEVVGLQEAAMWVLQRQGAGDVVYDFVTILREELAVRGLLYEVAAQNDNFTAQAPDSNGNTILFLDRDVLLIRKVDKLEVIAKQEVRFVNNLVIGAFVIVRGWSSIDVRVDGQVFRVINTHLEPLDERIRNLQAMEILNGPANTPLPLVILGDLNAVPGSSTYKLFVDADFRDVWKKGGEGSGFTSLQGPDLLNNVSQLSQRVDYILSKNSLKPEEADVVGEEQTNRTPTGLWPSDHAGVYALLKLKVSQEHSKNSE